MVSRNLLGELEYDSKDVQRLVKTCDCLSAMIDTLAGILAEQNRNIHPADFLYAMTNHQIELASLKPGRNWYHLTPMEILVKLAQAKTTESLAAVLLDTHIVAVRQRMIEAFGWGWRDLEELSEAALTWLYTVNAVSGGDDAILEGELAAELMAAGVVTHTYGNHYMVQKEYRGGKDVDNT